MSSRYFGARIRRNEDEALLTGRATFVDDVQLPGTLHAAFKDSFHTQISRNFGYCFPGFPVLENRCAGNSSYRTDPGNVAHKVIMYPISKRLIGLVSAKVSKWQHGNGST